MITKEVFSDIYNNRYSQKVPGQPKQASMNKNWLVILNPNAGIQRGKRDWPIIKQLLEKNNISYRFVSTEYKEHAITLTKKLVSEGYKKIIGIGGDGTFNEIANGILQQKKYNPTEINIGIITIGTGNDWGRMYNIPFNYNEAIRVILNGKIFTQDVCKAVYSSGLRVIERYLVNMAGMGFDAEVALKVNAQKEDGKGGRLSYFKNIFTTLLYYKPKIARITIDEQHFSENIFSINCGVCQYNGGGMKQLPHAIPDDGNLAFTLIKKINKFTVIINTRKLYSGSFIKLPEVLLYKGKEISVESDKNIYLEIDGESVGHTPISFHVKPAAISVITNNSHL